MVATRRHTEKTEGRGGKERLCLQERKVEQALEDRNESSKRTHQLNSSLCLLPSFSPSALIHGEEEEMEDV